MGRREVLGGKAKFGIFGDGKEVAQLAMAHAFRKGDFRSGYYRDQTFSFATGMCTLQEFFAQLYADIDLAHEPQSGGRQMNGHFATRSLDENGRFKALSGMFNNSADISPTGSQMPRLVGLAWASKLYREAAGLKEWTQFSHGGDEIAWGTIGNASCAEGMFFESLNAAGVMQIPMLVSVWDDGYGISVPNELQITKNSISELLSGFQRDGVNRPGFDLHVVKGWDYPALMRAYEKAANTCRRDHIPTLIHVVEITQPQGHSTSGSHERYKTKERLKWEEEHDCIRKMREWILSERMTTERDLARMEDEDTTLVREMQRKAWEAYRGPIDAEVKEVLRLTSAIGARSAQADALKTQSTELERNAAPFRRDIMRFIHNVLVAVRSEDTAERRALISFRDALQARCFNAYSSELHSESPDAALEVQEVRAQLGETSLNGFEVLNQVFDLALKRHPNLFIFGEDVGRLGDVNQGCAGLQEKYGVLRVGDTGIRECTIMGQAIGMAMRGLRPIVEIQYLDYVLYALQIMSDDLATVRWRTRGGQKAPVIVRTRGHRLEGVWHSGSPMAGMLNLMRGMYLCVPRNMVQAAGMYHTLLQGDDPAVVVEVLNGYRLKERLPQNLEQFTVPLGVPEVLRPGRDVTVVTYGASCRLVQEAAEQLAQVGVDVEILDVQTLLPFDLHGVILESIKKTSRVVFVDEDVPGGATAFMLQQVLEVQKGYQWLDSEPRTVAAQEHRTAYGSDGDYWSKPNRETLFTAIYNVMHEAEPARFPQFLR